MASIIIASSLSSMTHPHNAGPLYTDEEVVDIATARALKLLKATDAIIEAELAADAAAVTKPATAPSDDALATAADKAAQDVIAAELASLQSKPPAVVVPEPTTPPATEPPIVPAGEPTSAQTPAAKRRP